MLPSIAHANNGALQPPVTGVEGMTFADLVDLFIGIINDSLIPFILVLIFIFFAWKLIDMFIINVADEQARTNGKRTIVITIIVLVVVLSIWGILNLLRASIFPG